MQPFGKEEIENGAKEPEYLARALMIKEVYSRLRDAGLKHSAAVAETVIIVRQLNPGMRISEAEVRRVLAEFRLQGSLVELKVDYSILEGEEAAKRRHFFAQMAALAGSESTTELTDQNFRRPLKCFKFGFAKRTNYPRHNAVNPVIG